MVLGRRLLASTETKQLLGVLYCCIIDGAHWSSEAIREVAQQPVRQSVGSRCFVHIDLAQFALNIRLTYSELVRDNLWWWRCNVVIEKAEISSHCLKKTVHAVCQCLRVAAIVMISKTVIGRVVLVFWPMMSLTLRHQFRGLLALSPSIFRA